MVNPIGNSARISMLREIREAEATLAINFLPQGGRILEIGAGRGLQARYFNDIGFTVSALDIEDSSHIGEAVFPVRVYDGKTIPFPNETFDIIFSSNVLEHVPWCENLLLEMSRVLKSDGVMVHIVPTPSWRLWTSAAHYIMILQLASSLVKNRIVTKSPERCDGPKTLKRKNKSFLHMLKAGLFPFRHGAHGNWITEIYYFSRFRWYKTFYAANLTTVSRISTGLFYTGYGIPGATVSMDARTVLAKWLGSSTVLYVLNRE